MATCNPFEEISLSCFNSLGGVKQVWINNYDSVTGVTTDSVGTVTAATANPVFVEIQATRDGITFNEATNISLENGSTFVTGTVTIKIPRKNAATRAKLNLFLEGQPKVSLILLDQNGLYWAFGWKQFSEGAYATANDGTHGAVKSDGSNYLITFVCESAESAPEITSSLIASLT